MADEAREYRCLHKTDLGTSPGQAQAASRQVIRGDVRELCGWAVAETGGVAGATIRLRDGTGVNNEVFCRIDLNANESARDFALPHGIECSTGNVWLEVLSGSVEGVIYWR